MGPQVERFVCSANPREHQEDRVIPEGQNPWKFHPACTRCGAETHFAPSGKEGEMGRKVIIALLAKSARA